MKEAVLDGEAGASTGRATLLVVFSAACFSTIAIFVTIATARGVPLLQVLSLRYLAGALLLVTTVRARQLRLPAGRVARLSVLAGTIQAILAVTSLSALRYIPAATMVVLFYTYPAWVAVLAALRGTERVNMRTGTAVAVAFAGIALLVGMPGTAALHPGGAALALLAALIYALYIPLLGHLQQGLDSSVASIFVVGGAGIVLGVMALATGQVTTTLPAAAWGAIFGLGLISTALAFATFLRGLRVLGAVRASIASTVEPFCTAILAAMVLDQPITPPMMIGGVLIAAAVLLLQSGKAGLDTSGPAARRDP